MSDFPAPSLFDPVVLPGSNNRDMTDHICGLAAAQRGRSCGGGSRSRRSRS